MKAAKKRYYKREPDFWKILKGEPTLRGRVTIDAGMFYCPYIPLMHYNPAKNTTDNVTLTVKTRYEQTTIQSTN